MPPETREFPAVRVHLTNVAGLGATELAKSLLPALEAAGSPRISAMYLPSAGLLAGYRRRSPGPSPVRYERLLPNGLSRLLECTVLGSRFDGDEPLLVLGDLPIRCTARQVVFVQTALLTHCGRGRGGVHLKYAIARTVFRWNLRRIAAAIVQTEAMRRALLGTYPKLAGRVHVVAQPVPGWLMSARGCRTGRIRPAGSPLRLVYPAGGYPHKNHRLLAGVKDASGWPVDRLTLTIAPETNPNSAVPWIDCTGVVTPARVLEYYRHVDALLFLSNEESYGFPLVESMWVGLPIVCPDLPYARALCGGEAIYFDPARIDSLHAAVKELHRRLADGWWPSWDQRLKSLPSSWEQVAREILAITLAASSPLGPGATTDPRKRTSRDVLSAR